MENAPDNGVKISPGLIFGGRLHVHHVGEDSLPNDLLRAEQPPEAAHVAHGQVVRRSEVNLKSKTCFTHGFNHLASPCGMPGDDMLFECRMATSFMVETKLG